MKAEYPTIIFLTLVVLFILWMGIGWTPRDGMSVYMQRDDHQELLLPRRKSSAATTGPPTGMTAKKGSVVSLVGKGVSGRTPVLDVEIELTEVEERTSTSSAR